jgi:hemerythrin superfamily protein
MDAIRMLESDHRKVEELFAEYRTHAMGRGTRGGEIRERLFERICEELSVHAAIEEEVIYPEMRKCGDEGESLVEEALEEHQKVKETLAELGKISTQDSGFDSRLTALMDDVNHHVQEEEGEAFPFLQRHVSAERLAELGKELESAKKIAPTHPHPHAPNRPPASTIAGAAASVVDKLRDAVSKH